MIKGKKHKMNRFMQSKRNQTTKGNEFIIPDPVGPKEIIRFKNNSDSTTSSSQFTFKDFKKMSEKKKSNDSEDSVRSEVKVPVFDPKSGVSSTPNPKNPQIESPFINVKPKSDFSSIQVEYEKESCYDADTDIEDDDYETDKTKDYNKKIVDLHSNNCFISSNDIKDNDKIIDIELVPYIFTEQFNNTKDCYDSSTFSKFLFIDSTTFNILNQETIKTILNKLGQCLYEHKLVSLKGYPKLVFNGSYYTINCRIVIDDERFEDINISSDSDIINKSYEKYMSKVQDFKIYANTDIYFYNPKYIKEYLNIYIRHIFGYSAHKINYSCDLQKEISGSLKCKLIDPFTYFRSTIPIKKSTVNYKDNEYTNIMKVGFVFNGDINKIDNI